MTIYFTEYWPAYQCSLDQQNWSPVIMLDPNRIYPDDATDYIPVDLVNGLFPLTDETGLATGVYFGLVSLLPAEYTLLVTTPAGGTFGPTAVLELDIAQPSYLNAVAVTPYRAS